MLGGLRRAGQTWLGRAIVAVLFSILIVSFAIWGIGDIFRGRSRTTVATIGSAEISAETLRNAYQAEVQRLSRGQRMITPDQARQFGIDAQVLNRLIGEAALDAKANAMRLGVSDEAVARSITEEPAFRGADGRFDRELFEGALRRAGLNEAGFVREQRQSLRRAQIAEALTGDLVVPLAAREAAHRYGAERRGAAFLVLPAAGIGDGPAPSEEELRSFYEDRKASFRAPEYRTINLLVLSPDSAAQPGSVSDEEARARYEQTKAQRFSTPERRTLQQIEFPTRTEAEAALRRIREGASFEAIAAERGVADAALTLGTFARRELVDPAVAAAAFSLEQGAVSDPVEGRFGIVLLRVAAVEPEAVRSYEQAAAELKREIALERARSQIGEVHDRIEDLRAQARPLADIAKETRLSLAVTPPLTRDGRDKAGAPVPALPERDALLNAAFAADVGSDNEPIRTPAGGYVWYEVAGIEPARDRQLDEVKEQVLALWRTDQAARRLADQARGLVQRLDAGESVEAVAASLGLQAKTVADLGRAAPKEGLTSQAVAQIFATPVGRAGSASATEGRVVFKVTDAVVPPFVTTTREAERIGQQFQAYLADDLLAQYLAQVQRELGVAVDPQMMRRAIGGDV